jgi:cytochrome c
MNDSSNTTAGWILGAGIVALGSTILFSTVFHAEVPHEGKQGYAIEGVEDTSGGPAAVVVPLPNLLASADAAKGEAVFKKCTSCHSIAQGGATGTGPNLWATMGKPLAGHAGFAYSDSLKGVGGNWTFEKMNDWLANPKKFASGTKMSFAGLGKAQDRANLMVYMNAQGSNIPLPVPVAADAAATPAAPAGGAAPAAGATPADPAKATAPAEATKAK